MAEVTALDILIGAREMISDPKVWGKGPPYDRPVLTLCSVEAITSACPILWSHIHIQAEQALRVAAGLPDGSGSRDLAIWNDSPSRTHAEVLAAFDKAIETLRVKE